MHGPSGIIPRVDISSPRWVETPPATPGVGVHQPCEALVFQDRADACCLAEFAQNVVDVRLDRREGDEELTRDLLVRAVLGHELEHLSLAGGELVQRGRVAGRSRTMGMAALP